MRSLLHQTTLAITAVLVLISCATQTQAAGEQKAAEEGLSHLRWSGRVGGTFSSAELRRGGEPAYMTCTTSDHEKAIFDALMGARDRGANKEYSNYVKYPLRAIAVPEGPAQPAGNCLIYHDIDAPFLEHVTRPQSYLDRLVFLNQVMPQLLKGFIYLFNAGIRHVDTDLRKVMLQQLPTGQSKATIFIFDVVKRPLPPSELLTINTPSAKSSPNSPNPYVCKGFHQALLDYITKSVSLRVVKDPLNITPEDRMEIAQIINQKVRLAASTVPTKTTLEEATNAYISVLQATAILVNGDDCSSFAAALRHMQGQQPRSS
ncbi:hypothetical protein BDF22DRAFT_777723 [Syncephalis plumigaleata]|nr:hypothetical protein BDF22DRAFT_777723 [Syncephalis plumigaleata]